MILDENGRVISHSDIGEYGKYLRDPISIKAIYSNNTIIQKIFDKVINHNIIDIATPLTFERYTGNWKGCFEGWLITPENSKVLMKPMSQSIPGLSNFYMCGQWVEPGGGLPTAVMSGRRLVKRICKEDGRRFRTT